MGGWGAEGKREKGVGGEKRGRREGGRREGDGWGKRCEKKYA